jgi:hypothetical protein
VTTRETCWHRNTHGIGARQQLTRYVHSQAQAASRRHRSLRHWNGLERVALAGASREKEALAAVREFHRQHGRPPVKREREHLPWPALSADDRAPVGLARALRGPPDARGHAGGAGRAETLAARDRVGEGGRRPARRPLGP